MNRDARIKLYKRIYGKYNYKLENLTPDELHNALESGFLVRGFESFASHDEAIKKAKERAALIDKQEIADAFLYSLSSSLCEYRSPLLSYYYINSIPVHDFDGLYYRPNGEELIVGFCKICSYNNKKEISYEFGNDFLEFKTANHTLIMKYLWGSAIIESAYYMDNCILDITNYLTMPKAPPSAQGKEIFIKALELTEQLKPSDKAGAYIKLLYKSKIIPNSTKMQISTFVNTLGSLNILHRPGDYAIIKGPEKYNSTYKDPVEPRSFIPFPLSHWRASDGVDWDEVKAIFSVTRHSTKFVL